MNSTVLKTILMLIVSLASLTVRAKVIYDQKCLSVGVISNLPLPAFTDNPNIRYLETLGSAEILNKGGFVVLDKLINLRNPSMSYLYSHGVKEATREEKEIAEKDVSATPKDILKYEGSIQLLKNNYIIPINKEYKYNKKEKRWEDTGSYIWNVFHVDIDDEIINQVFSNWDSPHVLKQIKPQLKLIASGKIKGHNLSRIVFDISKEVGAFAIRGPIMSNHPTTATIRESQGVVTGDKIKVYKTVEDKGQNVYSKKIADARCGKVGSESSVLNIISGRYPNYKNGDIAVVVGNGGWSLNVETRYSSGSDYKVTYDVFSEKLLKYYSSGVSSYFIWGGEYGQFKKTPEKVWYKSPTFSSECIRPTMINFGAFVGYSLGYSFLTKFELLPYITAGCNIYTLRGIATGYIWDTDTQQFLLLSNDPNPDLHKSFMTIGATGGLRLAYNIYYPFQIAVGCNYSIHIPLANPEENFVTKRHNLNRINITIGFRYNF